MGCWHVQGVCAGSDASLPSRGEEKSPQVEMQMTRGLCHVLLQLHSGGVAVAATGANLLASVRVRYAKVELAGEGY